MTSSNFYKAGLGAALAFGLAVAPLAISPALANVAPEPTESAAELGTEGNRAPAAPLAALPAVPNVIINEAYLNGGSANASFKNKFVELYNPTNADINLSGWSLQYRSATGSVAPSGLTGLAGTIKANDYYLIKGNSNGDKGLDLPPADADTGSLAFSGSAGTLFLSNKAERLPADLATGSLVGTADIVDLLGYGTSNTFEAVPAGGQTVALSLNRSDAVDTDNNSTDFTTAAPTPTGTAGGVEPPKPPEDAGNKTIAEIQGEGAKSAFEGSTVTTKGKVTAAYPTGGFDGYFIQTPGTGGDLDMATHKASNGVFVYSPGTVAKVKIGDYVQVSGLVKEFGGATDTTTTTEIDVPADGMTVLDEAATEVKAAVVSVPETTEGREALEGMLVAPQGEFTITDNYTLNNYGEVGLAVGTKVLLQPTAVGPVGSAAHTATIATNATKAIRLDDGASTNFLNAAGQSVPLPWLSAATPMRVGSTAEFATNVIFDNRNNAYKFQPLEALTPANAEAVQPIAFGNNRVDAPSAVGGDLKVATFNVQNYFTQTGDKNASCQFYNDRAGNPITVRTGCLQRGAANAANLTRQQAKIVAGIHQSGADVLSLEEIENSVKFGEDRDFALATLVAALNVQSPGVWDYVRSPGMDQRPSVAIEDVIRTAFIYKVAVAKPVGTSAILDDPAFTGIARQPLAQAFTLAGNGEGAKVILIANHFKSKGSPATPDDIDKGQGNSNLARTAQATALVKFSNAQQSAQGTDKVLLMGDFNSYTFEDPMLLMAAAGYVDQGAKTGKHSYAFGGLVGSLDHIVATPALDAFVTGADIWNINSTESIAMGYSRYNSNVTDFYDTSAFAASDHDPVVVGLNLAAAASAPKEINLLNINDFHGRIDSNTVKFAGTVEQLRAASGDANTAFLSAGDNIGASLFASASQDDKPTIDVLNALDLSASAVGNHEFDKGWADLEGRVQDAANWSYLGANVYAKGTTTPVLDEYKIITVNGVKVAIIGAITEETPTLVTPSGISMLEFGDPVEAVNRVAKKITDGKLADVIVAEYHEGAGAGTPDGATFEQELAAGGAFAEIVTKTSASVNAIFTGHTHKQYAWDAPIPGVASDAVLKTRPILQTGSYGEFIGQVKLQVDANNKVLSYTQSNVARSKVDDSLLVAAFPRVAEVKAITDAALEAAKIAGSVPVGKISADITTAQTFDAASGKYSRDDRSSESTLGNLVGNSLLDALKGEQTGGAEIGVVNPGGLRADLLYKNAGLEDGVVTYANANAVLPFVNNLWTTSLTGAQVKTMLEQQWQTNADGPIPSRPFLNLGLSSNVDYTYDSSRALGDHITSVVINGAPLDTERSYRVGTFSFLATGGDNFRVFTEGTNTKDSGLIDRDAWIAYLGAKSAEAPIAPDFARRGVDVVGAPSTVKEGQVVTLTLKKLDLTSLGTPVSTKVTVRYENSGGGAAVQQPIENIFIVNNGSADLKFKMPKTLNGGRLTITTDGGTSAGLPIISVTADAGTPTDTESPSPTGSSTAPGTSAPGTSPSATSTAGGGAGSGTGNGSGNLANTGATALPLGLGALVLVGAGVAVAMASRRKEARH
ncbi:ExeM/NucH family extracellular endonuclease [Arthrobacter psychrochitiniphilus]|uniref:Multifunctional nuclease/2',3'-cyclic-nucleotide 2'-phosphodiesterase/5'-nucleotidase/3'-nucleotidase n=1 Tax=Arthrobacter psychrochitiniphilus TaxID=291045 RepID=A0A2V3E0C7_9MICC|nr:ExeM/NucH family extracellular endonuclease [Arthrobacter psychrochitiniphilus]NYG15870.1 5'-nucleotidase [Arthrobacter psychrochitiniphilus]PXA66693.1 multifunctional nuclease/2',3'-cyclic-nucleotide 2'-phosphodiesterase/5'-nucleotidase/3'-nucleotidase [Arthrobacter psychrochitiniphilus]